MEKMIDERVRRILIKYVCVIILAFAAVFAGISLLLNLSSTNPAKLNEGNPGKLLPVMRAYYETMYPYREVYNINEVEAEGFGSYKIHLSIIDHREKIEIGRANVIMAMKRGKLSITNDTEGLTVFNVPFNEDGSSKKQKAKELRELAEEIRKLPESSRLYLSIKGEAPISIASLMEKNKGEFQAEWAQVYEPGCDFQAGLSLNLSAVHKDSDMRHTLTGKQLKQVYLENLKLLRDNMEIWKNLDMPSNSSIFNADSQLLDELIQKGEKSQTFQTVYYCVSADRDGILAYLNSGGFDQVAVDRVQCSTL